MSIYRGENEPVQMLPDFVWDVVPTEACKRLADALKKEQSKNGSNTNGNGAPNEPKTTTDGKEQNPSEDGPTTK